MLRSDLRRIKMSYTILGKREKKIWLHPKTHLTSIVYFLWSNDRWTHLSCNTVLTYILSIIGWNPLDGKLVGTVSQKKWVHQIFLFFMCRFIWIFSYLLAFCFFILSYILLLYKQNGIICPIPPPKWVLNKEKKETNLGRCVFGSM